MRKNITFSALVLLPLYLGAVPDILFPPRGEWRLEQQAEFRDGGFYLNGTDTKKDSFPKAQLFFKAKRGKHYTFSAKIRGKGISKPRAYWQGVRLMLVGNFSGQWKEFSKPFDLSGDFDWKTISFSFDAPADFDGWLICGLREVTGELWIEEITVDTARPGEKPAVPEKSAEALKNEQADLGFVVLSRFSPNSFEFQQMLDSWRKRLGKADEYRDFLMNLYQGFAGNALSPNYCGWDRKGRIERLPKELAARFTDWRTNMQGLAKFGLHSSADSEITALQKLLKLHKTDTAVYPVEIERAVGYYTALAEERARLGASLLELDREFQAFQRLAEFRNSQGSSISTDELKERWTRLKETWRNDYNAGNFYQCYLHSLAGTKLRGEFARTVYIRDGRSPVVRPGAGTYAVGVFGFEGSWHTLLCTNTTGTSLYADSGNEFQPYTDSKDGWSVSFDIPGMTSAESSVESGSWTHSVRKFQFKALDGSRKHDVTAYWSALAPGVLYDFPSETVAVSDNTLQYPCAPAGIIAECDGKIGIFPVEHFDPSRLSANWLVLCWENPAAKMPVLLVFEKRPHSLRVTDGSLRIGRKGGVGKFAAATLYGAAPQDPAWGSWQAVPGEVAGQIAAVVPLLTYFPLEMEEFYANDREGRITVWNRVVSAVKLAPQASEYVPFPPLFSQALSGKSSIAGCDPLEKSPLMTKFGPFRFRKGKLLSYRLEAPDLLDRIPLRPDGEEELIAEFNRVISERSISGEWRENHLSDQALGLMHGWLLMDERSRKTLNVFQTPGQLDRIAGGEAFYGRARGDASWLIPTFHIEPATGKSAWLAGWRGFRHGSPMKGDMTAFNMQLLQFPLAQGKWFGRWDLVERHWNRLREYYSAVPFCQTWRAPGMNCTNTGIILSSDMYGDGFRCYSIMYRLAQAMKDEELEDNALYLAAKQTASTTALLNPNVPVVARHLHNTGGKEVPDGDGGWHFGVDNRGIFTLDWEPENPNAWNAPWQLAGCVSYDHPFFGMLTRFLPESTLAILNEQKRRVPGFFQPDYLVSPAYGARICNAHNSLKLMAFLRAPKEEVREMYRTFAVDYLADEGPSSVPAEAWKKYHGGSHFWDWPLRVNSLPHIIAQNDPVWIGDFGRMRLYQGSYDRGTRTARIELGAETDDTLVIVSQVKPDAVSVNQTPAKFTAGAWGCDYSIPIPKGAAVVRIELPELPEPSPFSGTIQPTIALSSAPAPAGKPAVQIPARQFKVGRCVQVDLTNAVNQPLNDSLPDARQDRWKFPAAGKPVQICGVPFTFNAKGLVMLRGHERPQKPQSVRIPVPGDGSFRRIFFLHGSCYSRNGRVLTYRLHFTDGQTRDIEVFNRAQIGEWKAKPGSDSLEYLPAAPASGLFKAAAPGQWGEGVGGYVFAWENNVRARGMTAQGVDQQGTARLESIEAISAGGGVPLILAVTLEK